MAYLPVRLETEWSTESYISSEWTGKKLIEHYQNIMYFLCDTVMTIKFFCGIRKKKNEIQEEMLRVILAAASTVLKEMLVQLFKYSCMQETNKFFQELISFNLSLNILWIYLLALKLNNPYLQKN